MTGRSLNESLVETNAKSVCHAINVSKSSNHELAIAGRLVTIKTLVALSLRAKS